MRRNKPGLNVILCITYILIVVAALTVITLSVTTYVGKYFLSQRNQAQKKVLNDCAFDIMPYLDQANPDRIYSVLTEYAIKQNGRILLLDSSGVVQVDTFCTLNGTKPDTSEIALVLSGEKTSVTGYHKAELSEQSVTRDNPYVAGAKRKCWTAYSAQAVSGSSDAGVLLLISPVQDIVANINTLSWGLFAFSLVFTLLIAGVTFYITNLLTLSIRKFSRAVTKMSMGDFSVRVSENEIAEFGELAKAFNMMASQVENLDASRNQFVSDASHELKTPLASMKILSEALLTQEDAPKELYREFMNDINSEVDRLSLVINDLLTLVKTDKGLETLIFTHLNLGELLTGIITSVAPLAQKKHITVEYQYKDISVYADELRLRQVFTNLIDNAIKYSPDNTVITVSSLVSGGSAVVEVRDRGIGVAKENLPHLFERFYRVDKARSRSAGGTGLGLSIVKQIVEQHGGEIFVESELGKGTVFTVKLPLEVK